MTRRTHKLLAAITGLVTVAASASGVLAPEASAAASTVVTYEQLQAAVGGDCVSGDIVTIGGVIEARDRDALIVRCDMTVDLAATGVAVGTVTIVPGVVLTVTDSTTAGTPGSLTAEGSSWPSQEPGVSTTGATLRVEGRAHLTATGASLAAGIGGGDGEAGGSIIISGQSVVTAHGGSNGAGIGGGAGGAGGTTTVTDSAVVSVIGGTGRGHEEADHGGAGIGGGSGGAGGITTITDSARVDTTGGTGWTLEKRHGGGAGIGGGGDGAGGATTITGGARVNARGEYGGAGIGGGDTGTGGVTTISGAAVIDALGSGGAGIGGGDGAAGGTTDISGTATIATQGRSGGAGIGGGEGGAGAQTTIAGHAVITTEGRSGGAGIGGGEGGAGARTTIAGQAVVSVIGRSGAAGIGGGRDAGGATTVITDHATVDAVGGYGGAGIGGGSNSDGAHTTIADEAVVHALGRGGGAGIGGGRHGDGGVTTILDAARVTAGGMGEPGAVDDFGDPIEAGTGAGIGGGGVFLGDPGDVGGAGGVTTIDGRGATALVVVTPGVGASAVGAGAGATEFGALTVTDGVVNVVTGELRLARGRSDDPEITLGEGGLIESRPVDIDGGTVGGDGQLVSDGTGERSGRLDNGGAITLPTRALDEDLQVLDHHYEVPFDPNGSGASLDEDAPEDTVVFAESFEAGERAFPEDPTRPGYTFTGWSTTPSGAGEPVTADGELPWDGSLDGEPVEVTAYARWRSTSGPPPTNPEPPVEGPLPAVRASVDGQPKVGKRLTASGAVAGDVDGVSYAYQWLRDGEPIAGADSRTYRPGRADIAREVSVEVTASAPGRTSSTDASRGVAVRPLVGMVGVTRVGEQLTPRVVVPDSARATYVWETSKRPARGGQRVWERVSTADSYTLRPRDAGQRVRLVVTISGAGFSRVVSYSDGHFVRR